MTLRNGFTLGSFEVHPLEGRLASDAGECRVQPKSMDVLLCLAEAEGKVVEREELLRRVWGDRAPTDEPLTRCIGELRRALGDSRADPEFILTVPKRGYRLLLPAIEITHESNDAGASSRGCDDAPTRTFGRHAILAISMLVVITIVMLPTVIDFLNISLDKGETEATMQAAVPAGDAASSIAVMPFVNMSPDSEYEYFSDGITEEILNLLARFPDLRVISRSSAFSYKGRNLDIPTIASELRVTHVLEGSFRRSGERVRITAQLIEAGNDAQLWSETYERTLDDIFATQDDIARKVAEQLKLRLLGDRRPVREFNTEAYALFLQARYLSRQFTPESFEKSIALLEEAIAHDPEYAAAWDQLGRMYRRQAGQGLKDVDESYALARDATNRAIALDPDLPSAHASLAVIARNYDRDLAAAAAHVRRAYELAPGNAGSVLNAAGMAAALGRVEQAIALQEYAVAKDPVNPVINTFLGTLYLDAGRHLDAIAAFRTTLLLNPGYIGAQFLVGEGYLLMGDPESALASFEMEDDEGYRLIGLVMAHHALGDNAASDGALEELIRKYERDAPYNIAYTLAYRGDADGAFEWLDKAATYNDPGLSDVIKDPLFENIHSDRRWLSFLESIGKSPAQLAQIEFDVVVPE